MKMVFTMCGEIFRMLGAVKLSSSSPHAQIKGMVERLDHSLRLMLSHLVADDHSKWDAQLVNAITAQNSFSRGTEFVPNETHIKCFPRLLPITVVTDYNTRRTRY